MVNRVDSISSRGTAIRTGVREVAIVCVVGAGGVEQ